mmetsp:Transcript_4080/g.8985  ORF Transcript_4080/g.8985 Transcript_4080/m.8985 type:complete len:372 (-) Transcript_4080:277-1392(-)
MNTACQRYTIGAARRCINGYKRTAHISTATISGRRDHTTPPSLRHHHKQLQSVHFPNANTSRITNGPNKSNSMSTSSQVESHAPAIIHPSIESIRAVRKSFDSSVSVGFVPTMGALHEGHLSLARMARSQNDVVIASIFVNPAQFGKGEDLDTYPRQVEKDVELLTEIGVDHVFVPSSDMMYGKNHVTYIDPQGFDQTREGAARPGFFRGVATVVAKLFNIVQPTNAYFGQKDAVQCIVIKRIVSDLDMDINVHIMNTVREDDGLALSSRNAYLTPEEREKAPIVYQALCAAREVYESRFARGMEDIDAADLLEVVEGALETEPLVTEVQYVAIDDLETMKPLEKVGNEGCIVSLACKLGSVRLIDNIILK